MDLDPMRVFAVSPIKGGKVRLASEHSSYEIELTWPWCQWTLERWAEKFNETVGLKLIDGDGNWRETYIIYSNRDG